MQDSILLSREFRLTSMRRYLHTVVSRTYQTGEEWIEPLTIFPAGGMSLTMASWDVGGGWSGPVASSSAILRSDSSLLDADG